jgi:hypothetical protein
LGTSASPVENEGLVLVKDSYYPGQLKESKAMARWNGRNDSPIDGPIAIIPHLQRV